jgi:hypothetical protein
MRVLLGNSAAKEAYRGDDGALKHRKVKGVRITTIHVPDTYSLLEAVSAVTAQDGAWNHHSQGDNPDDTKPDWVESDHEGLALLLGAQMDCPVGRPKGWKEDY